MSKKVKVCIDCDERYPDYSCYKLKIKKDNMYEISKDKFKWIMKVVGDYEEVQNYLHGVINKENERKRKENCCPKCGRKLLDWYDYFTKKLVYKICTTCEYSIEVKNNKKK